MKYKKYEGSDSMDSNSDLDVESAVISRNFEIIQNEIQKLIEKDKNSGIDTKNIEEFNDRIFDQPDEIQKQIKQYVNKATLNNLDDVKVAKVLYDKFKLQVKTNHFDKDQVNDVQNPLEERKFIKTFEQFIK